MHEQNKALVRRFLEEVWNNEDMDTVDEIIALDYVGRTPLRTAHGPEGVKQATINMRKAFPDLRCTVDKMIAEDDLIAVYFSMRGTHKGTFMGVPPTGKLATWTTIYIYRITDGKLAKRWSTGWDTLDMWRQLGVAPKIN